MKKREWAWLNRGAIQIQKDETGLKGSEREEEKKDDKRDVWFMVN